MPTRGPHGPQPPGDAPTGLRRRADPGRDLSKGPLLGIVAIAAVVGALGGVVLASRGSHPAPTATVRVAREPVSSRGADPFMPPVGTDAPKATPPRRSAGAFTGDTPGLYGGVPQGAVCDRSRMVTFLQQHPDAGQAWANVIGIARGDVPRFVSGLTPALLRTDTYVTNHGYALGSPTTVPAVLQAGTAVLVDRHGAPVTKCYCGNPLTPAFSYTRPSYYGPRWPTFDAGGLTVIQPAAAVITTFTLVDPATAARFTRPAGTSGTADDAYTAASTAPTTPPRSRRSVAGPPATATAGAPSTSPPELPAQPASPRLRSTQPPSPRQYSARPPSPRGSSKQPAAPAASAAPESVPTAPDAAEQQAAAILDRAGTECDFHAPIEPPTDGTVVSFADTDTPDTFFIHAEQQTVTGETQQFTWAVDRSTGRFTPVDGLAAFASRDCPLLR
jgi:hypothetical protein